MAEALWIPTPERVAASNMEAFRILASGRAGRELADTDDIHAWSIADPAGFWSLVWDDVGVIGEKGEVAFVPGDHMSEGRFFPEARLNYAENLLEGPDGNRVAIEYRREDAVTRTITWGELRREAAAFAAALRAIGVGAGDRVAAWMPNVPETVIAMLGSASIGAVFSSTSSDFGPAGVVDRFGQIEPKVLVAADAYLYGGRRFDRMEQLAAIRSELPSLERVVLVSSFDDETSHGGAADTVGYRDFIDPHLGAEAEYAALAFDHPLYVLYSSGTTGKPKCMVHRAGGLLLKHMEEHRHHCDLSSGDRLFYFTTCGWMMWNWLVTGLAQGITIVLYDGNPFHPGPEALFRLIEDVGITMLGVSAKYIDAVAKSGFRPVDSFELASLRLIASTGSPLAPESFEFVYDSIKRDVHLASLSGGTDLCGCLVGGDPTKPVYAGEIQAPILGMATDVFDDTGRPIRGERGELVCTESFPSMPLTFWGEDGDARYRTAYYERFPGVWTHGDYALWTEHGGMVMLGRSDATLNAGGVRIGTSEIYRIVEQFPEVVEAVAVGQRWNHDTRVVMFVRMADGHSLTDDLETEIRNRLRDEESPRHVPSVILPVADIPRTRSGKISELAVRAVVNGETVDNTEALANPEALDLFAGRPELEV